MSTKKLMTAVATCLTVSAVCAFTTFAAPAKTAAEGEELSLRVRITGHEKGTIYKVTTTDGQEIRMDVGKHGGRMLNRHYFTAKGEMKIDEKGDYFYNYGLNQFYIAILVAIIISVLIWFIKRSKK